jgi:hypothetical protein
MSDSILGAVLCAIAFIAVMLLAFLGIATYSAATGTNQETADVTETCALPPELAGARVYRLVPAGFGQTLYVITRNGHPEDTAWEWHEGKQTHRAKVIGD